MARERVRLHADLTMLARLSLALAQARVLAEPVLHSSLMAERALNRSPRTLVASAGVGVSLAAVIYAARPSTASEVGGCIVIALLLPSVPFFVLSLVARRMTPTGTRIAFLVLTALTIWECQETLMAKASVESSTAAVGLLWSWFGFVPLVAVLAAADFFFRRRS